MKKKSKTLLYRTHALSFHGPKSFFDKRTSPWKGDRVNTKHSYSTTVGWVGMLAPHFWHFAIFLSHHTYHMRVLYTNVLYIY